MSTMRLISRALLVGVMLVAQLGAQGHRAAIRGHVIDPSGAAVVAAAVTVLNEATNERRETATGDGGAFAIVELAPGTWRVEIVAPGHKTYVQRLTLEVNQERRADVQLEIGALTDRVEVT